MGLASEGGDRTSMNDVLAVKIVHRSKHLFDGLRSVFLREFALLANAVEQLAPGRQLRDDVVFVLSSCKSLDGPGVFTTGGRSWILTLDSNQSTNLTIWGCFKRWSMSSSS